MSMGFTPAQAAKALEATVSILTLYRKGQKLREVKMRRFCRAISAVLVVKRWEISTNFCLSIELK